MNPQNNPARIRAKRVLRHYFKMIASASGSILNSDAYTEIDNIVDDIIDAAVDQMQDKQQRLTIARNTLTLEEFEALENDQ
jgi:hypothetical protein